LRILGLSLFIYEPGNEFITDQSSCITTIKYLDGESKEINHYYGHVLIDDSLTAFENKIERIIGTKKYVNPKLYIYLVEENFQSHQSDTWLFLLRKKKQYL